MIVTSMPLLRGLFGKKSILGYSYRSAKPGVYRKALPQTRPCHVQKKANAGREASPAPRWRSKSPPDKINIYNILGQRRVMMETPVMHRYNSQGKKRSEWSARLFQVPAKCSRSVLQSWIKGPIQSHGGPETVTVETLDQMTSI